MGSLPKFTIVIPARSGSKRIHDKNIQLIDGRSLIQIALDFASNLPAQEIILSSDSSNYLNQAIEFPRVTKHLRSQQKSGDGIPAREVVSQLFEENRIPTRLAVLLQPTSPFRSGESVCQALSLADESNRNVFSVSPYRAGYPDWAMEKNSEGFLTLSDDFDFGLQSQDLKEKYYLNGNFYVFHREHIRNKEPTKANSIGFVCESEFEAIDIDSQFDLLLARRVFNDFLRNQTESIPKGNEW